MPRRDPGSPLLVVGTTGSTARLVQQPRLPYTVSCGSAVSTVLEKALRQSGRESEQLSSGGRHGCVRGVEEPGVVLVGEPCGVTYRLLHLAALLTGRWPLATLVPAPLVPAVIGYQVLAPVGCHVVGGPATAAVFAAAGRVGSAPARH